MDGSFPLERITYAGALPRKSCARREGLRLNARILFQMYREREDHNGVDTESPYHCAAMPIAPASPTGQTDPELEHYILGSWNTGRGLKENGLMKKVRSAFLLPLKLLMKIY